MSKITNAVGVLLILTCFAMTITGCDGSAEKKTDRSKEKSSGSNSIPGGGNWPDWVPSIVPEYKYGRVKTSVELPDKDGGALILGKIQWKQDPYASYKKDLLDKGWKVLEESEYGEGKHLNVKHGDYSLLYAFSKEGGVSIHYGKSDDGGNGGGSSSRGGGSAVGDGVVAGRVSFMFDGKQYSGTTCIANSFPGGNSTSITSGADEGELTLMLEIPGTATGEFDEKAGATCSFVEPPFNMYNSETVTITVSDYGKIGSAVKGTFSGMLVNQLDSTRKPITDGTFTAQRHLNVE